MKCDIIITSGVRYSWLTTRMINNVQLIWCRKFFIMTSIKAQHNSLVYQWTEESIIYKAIDQHSGMTMSIGCSWLLNMLNFCEMPCHLAKHHLPIVPNSQVYDQTDTFG